MRGPESRDLPLLGSLEGFLEVAACQVVLEANWARRGGCSLQSACSQKSSGVHLRRGPDFGAVSLMSPSVRSYRGVGILLQFACPQSARCDRGVLRLVQDTLCRYIMK